jgi:hypothetical protein
MFSISKRYQRRLFTNSVKQEWRKNSGKIRQTLLNYAKTQCKHFNTDVREVFKRVHNVAKSDYIIFVTSVRLSVRLSAWNNSAPSGWIFMKFGN